MDKNEGLYTLRWRQKQPFKVQLLNFFQHILIPFSLLKFFYHTTNEYVIYATQRLYILITIYVELQHSFP